MEERSDSASDFVQLFIENERRLFGYILSLVPNRAEAEDILQHSSMVLWKKFDCFDPGTSFLNWAISIARFEVKNHIAKKNRSRLVFEGELFDLMADEAASFAPQTGPREEALRTCLSKLSARDRDLLQRRYEEGSTIKSVAAAVGRPLEGIYKAMRRIHDTLRTCIERQLAKESLT